MLRSLAIAVAVLAGSADAAAGAHEPMRRPQKLTVAVSDELLGQLGPDGRLLYFASNRNATSQIFYQDLQAPASTLLFDEGADATWPRISPNGLRLAYISFRDDAAGRLCVRDLPSLVRRCLEAAEGALEAAWAGDDELVLLQRGSQEEDLRLVRVRFERDRLAATPLLQRNMNGPTVSPPVNGRRWLAFVPVSRSGTGIGPAFSARAGRQLVLRPLEGTEDQPVRFDLPGTSGQPAFSPDGKWLYFTQFLNDTDQNGLLDGDDHGVIFRVPFPAGDDPARALARALPEQLTSAAWNCQYPAPAATRLVLTCARTGSLDLYSVPLDGVVPSRWPQERLRDELSASRDRWERLLLLHHLVRGITDPRERAQVLLEVVRLHLGLREYEAALHHARSLGRLEASDLSALATTLEVQIAERRALLAFDRGQLGQRFLDEARRRLEELLKPPPNEPPAVATLRGLVASELYDDVGDKPAAEEALARATVDEQTPAFVVETRALRAEAVYREMDRPAELVAALRGLVDHPSLSEVERLRIGGVYARSVSRGLAPAQAKIARGRERVSAPATSSRAFALELDACLECVTPARIVEGRSCVARLYEAHPSPAARRTLVTEVLRRAEETDADDLEYELIGRYTRDIPRDAAERRHAERLFRHVVEDYAYGSLAAGHAAAAADEFQGVAREVDSLESQVGWIEATLAAGGTDLERRIAEHSREGSPERRFAGAYLDLRRLANLDGIAFDQAAAAALDDVQAIERELPQKAEVRSLHGALLHRRFLRTGDHTAAEEANTHYLLALDLSHENPRYRAMVLEQLGHLHARVGNHRIAIAYLDERARLPIVDPLSALGHQLARARSLLHLRRDAEAAKSAKAALDLAEKSPSLARFRPYAADRAALSALAAGDATGALAIYDRDGERSAGFGDHNRAARLLARAAAALSARQPRRAIEDLDRLDQAIVDPAVRRAMDWPEMPPDEERDTYDLLRYGLRAQAERALGRADQARRALEARHGLLLERSRRRELDDDLLSLALAEAQLAELARGRKAIPEAAALISQALAHGDDFARRSGTPLTDAQLAALGLAAELHLFAGAPTASFRFDLRARLSAAFERLSASRDPTRIDARHRLGVYLTLLSLDRAP